MTVLILVTFLVFLSSIHGEFNGPYSNLQITQTKTRVPFSTSDLVISNESVVHSDNESKSIVQISVKLAADDSTANQFHTTVSAETSARSTAISEATADSNQTTTTTESTTTLLTFQTGESPPTRSAQLGMGLGITLVGFVIIVEIIYFKCFYRGGLQTDSYLA